MEFLLTTLFTRASRHYPRHIPRPDNVRFHSGVYSRRNEGVHPALVVAAKDSVNRVQVVQAIFLDKDTAQKADVEVKKQTWGRPSQFSHVAIP